MNPPSKTGVIPKPAYLQKPTTATAQKPATATSTTPDGRQQFKASGSTMRPQTSEERRRAQRVLLKMPVLIHVQGKAKAIEGFTHTVSASGAMVILNEGLAQGTKITVENPKTQKKIDAHVVRPPQMNSEGSLVPIEFTAPSPNFWNIFFPPISN